MKRITFLTVAAAITFLAASCGQNAQKQTTNEPETVTQQTEEMQQEVQQETEPGISAYIKFDGKTLLVDDFLWVSSDDEELMKKYGLTENDMDDDYHIINEVKKYEEWKLLPNATFSIIKYINGSPAPVDVSCAEFVAHISQFTDEEYPHPPIYVIGSRSGVSRLEEIYIP